MPVWTWKAARCFPSEPTCRHMACVRVCVCGKGEFLSFCTFPPNEIIFTSLQCHGIISSLSKRHVTWRGGGERVETLAAARAESGNTEVLFLLLPTHTHSHTCTGEEYYSLWQVYHAPPRPTGPCYSELGAPCPVWHVFHSKNRANCLCMDRWRWRLCVWERAESIWSVDAGSC